VAAELLATLSFDPERAAEQAGAPPAPAAGRPVRVIQHVSNLVTREAVLSPGEAAAADLLPVMALERARGRQAFWGFLDGFGLREGAFGTTLSWDSPDLVVLGRDETAVRTVLRRLVENGGGGVFARGGEVVAEFRAPVCAVSSLAPAAQVRREITALRSALQEAGARWEDPLLAVDTLTTPAIPHLRMTHRGYVRLRDRALLPLQA
jgi:adenine deaminase